MTNCLSDCQLYCLFYISELPMVKKRFKVELKKNKTFAMPLIMKRLRLFLQKYRVGFAREFIWITIYIHRKAEYVRKTGEYDTEVLTTSNGTLQTKAAINSRNAWRMTYFLKSWSWSKILSAFSFKIIAFTTSLQYANWRHVIVLLWLLNYNFSLVSCSLDNSNVLLQCAF